MSPAKVAPISADSRDIMAWSAASGEWKTILEKAGYAPRYVPSGHLLYASRGGLQAVAFDIDRLEVIGVSWIEQEPFERGAVRFEGERGARGRPAAFEVGAARVAFILGTGAVLSEVVSIEVDREYRKKKDGITPSDHAPVILELG